MFCCFRTCPSVGEIYKLISFLELNAGKFKVTYCNLSAVSRWANDHSHLQPAGILGKKFVIY